MQLALSLCGSCQVPFKRIADVERLAAPSMLRKKFLLDKLHFWGRGCPHLCRVLSPDGEYYHPSLKKYFPRNCAETPWQKARMAWPQD